MSSGTCEVGGKRRALRSALQLAIRGGLRMLPWC